MSDDIIFGTFHIVVFQILKVPPNSFKYLNERRSHHCSCMPSSFYELLFSKLLIQILQSEARKGQVDVQSATISDGRERQPVLLATRKDTGYGYLIQRSKQNVKTTNQTIYPNYILPALQISSFSWLGLFCDGLISSVSTTLGFHMGKSHNSGHLSTDLSTILIGFSLFLFEYQVGSKGARKEKEHNFCPAVDPWSDSSIFIL